MITVNLVENLGESESHIFRASSDQIPAAGFWKVLIVDDIYWTVQIQDGDKVVSAAMISSQGVIFDSGLVLSANSSVLFSAGSRIFRVYFGVRL